MFRTIIASSLAHQSRYHIHNTSPAIQPLLRKFSTSNSAPQTTTDCNVLVIGAGSAGCAVAAQLNRRLGSSNVHIVEPSEQHYYQPMFTMIGGGLNQLSDARRPTSAIIPDGVRWHRTAAERIDAAANCVHTSDGNRINYSTLIIAVGLQLNYARIPGLTEALQQRDGNVTSIYSPLYVAQHIAALARYRSGPIVFTFPQPPVKCPGAPQKIAYITEHYLRREAKRDGAQLHYVTALPSIFGVPYFADALWPIARAKGIEVQTQRHLVEVKGAENRAVFESVERPGERHEMEYALLHVTPPQEVPPVLRKSVGNGDGLVNAGGFVDVDEQTLRHRRYANVWALGDCSATPNSKTMAAAGKLFHENNALQYKLTDPFLFPAAQSGIVVDNVLDVLAGRLPSRQYDGYAACPLVTGYDRCVMAEFDYRLQPLETFPVRQDRERYSMFLMKKYVMPMLYWHGMVRGWWRGPQGVRKLLGVFKS